MTALGDFSSGDVLTAADLNAIGEFTSYTPALEASGTNPTYSTATGVYYEMNEIVFVRFTISGITSAGSGTYYVTMPTDIVGDLFPNAFGLVEDSGIGRYPIIGGKSASGARRVFWTQCSNNATVSHNTPISWTSADSLVGTVIYRKA